MSWCLTLALLSNTRIRRRCKRAPGLTPEASHQAASASHVCAPRINRRIFTCKPCPGGDTIEGKCLGITYTLGLIAGCRACGCQGSVRLGGMAWKTGSPSDGPRGEQPAQPKDHVVQRGELLQKAELRHRTTEAQGREGPGRGLGGA